jgi:hypothetical protein
MAKPKKTATAVPTPVPAPVVEETTPVVVVDAAVPVPDEDPGSDWCRCGCGRPVERARGERYRFYASELCAYRGMMRRRGERSPLLERAVEEATQKQVERAQRPKPTPPARRERTQDERDHADLRYGPVREITKVLETYGEQGQRAKVEMACGHVRAWYAGETTARCPKCRPTPISGASGAPRRRTTARPAGCPEVTF